MYYGFVWPLLHSYPLLLCKVAGSLSSASAIAQCQKSLLGGVQYELRCDGGAIYSRRTS